MERPQAKLSKQRQFFNYLYLAVIFCGLYALAFPRFSTGFQVSPEDRAETLLHQFGTASESHVVEYGYRPKSVEELLGENKRRVVFLSLRIQDEKDMETDYRIVPPPVGTNAFIVEWIGLDGIFGTGDELQMIHNDTGVHIGAP